MTPDQPVKRYEDVPAIRLCSRAALDEFLSRYWPELLRHINDFSRTDAARVEAEAKATKLDSEANELAQLNNMLLKRIASLESDLSAVTASSVEHAKTIDGLRADLARARERCERLEAALREIAKRPTGHHDCDDYTRGYGQATSDIAQIARALLATTHNQESVT